MISLVKKKLQPIQNRVTSLTTQTAKYEQMKLSKTEKPTQFISTAVQELKKLMETIENEYDVEVNQYIFTRILFTKQFR